MVEALQIVLILLSIPVLTLMVICVVRSARELNRRIEEYREEQEASQSQPGPINPYQQIAELYRPGGNGDRQNGDTGRKTLAGPPGK